GNDDLGTMSAWNVLSSIGLFPVQPGYDTWGLTTPVFDRVDLTLDRRYWPAGRLTITAPGTSDTDRYVQSARVDGASYSRTYLTSGVLRSLSSLAFTVGPRPSDWGTSADAAPPALG
ncbi:glycoside hydrolase domain-containing protein, partial [Streptomyces sp. NRRL F-3307]